MIVGQALVAGGQVIGTRWITGLVHPGTFGTVALLVGASTLAYATACQPILQAALRLYHDANDPTKLLALRRLVAMRLAGWSTAIILLICASGVALSMQYPIRFIAFPILSGLLLVDVYRMYECNFLIAARRHASFALWSGVDSCARWTGGAVMVAYLESSPEMVLLGFLAGSSLVTACFGLALIHNRRRAGASLGEDISYRHKTDRELKSYALPLVPLGAAGWASGLADRYMLGVMAGLGPAGVYSAAYGLASKPFLMVQGILELVLRPYYFQAVATGDVGAARRVFRQWLWATGMLCAAGVLVVFLAAEPICSVLLGPSFQEGADYLGWIALGYALLAVGYVFEKVSYARKRTDLILLSQGIGGGLAIVIGWTFIRLWGVWGAVTAVPVYLGLQCLVSQAAAVRQVRV